MKNIWRRNEKGVIKNEVNGVFIEGKTKNSKNKFKSVIHVKTWQPIKDHHVAKSNNSEKNRWSAWKHGSQSRTDTWHAASATSDLTRRGDATCLPHSFLPMWMLLIASETVKSFDILEMGKKRRRVEGKMSDEPNPKTSPFSLSNLPEGCISNIISFMSPKDACRAAAVSLGFKSAADSDTVWERFLPPNYRQVISRASSRPPFSNKKHLYLFLHDASTWLLLDGGKLVSTLSLFLILLQLIFIFELWLLLPTLNYLQ